MLSLASFDLETSSINGDYGILMVAVIQVAGATDPIVLRGDVLNKKWKTKRSDDSAIVKETAEELARHDVLFAHNGATGRFGFDLPFLQARLAKHRLPPLPKKKIIDPVQIARNQFRLSGNSLESISAHLGLQPKMKLPPEVWLRASHDGDKESMDVIVARCVTPDARVLTADLRWIPAGEVLVGDALVGFEEHHSKGKGRRYQTAIVEAVSFAREPCVAVELDDGQVIVTTEDHKWLVGTNLKRGWSWRKTSQLRGKKTAGNYATKLGQLFRPWKTATDYDSGWLAGMLDGEGCYGEHGSRINFSQNENVALYKALQILAERSKEYRLEAVSAKREVTGNRRGAHVVQLNGTLPDRMAFLGSVRPIRLLDKMRPENFGRLERKCGLRAINRIFPVGDREIVKIQTSTGTLIVEGFPMHNCQSDVSILIEVVKAVRSYVSHIDSKGSSW